MFDLNRFSLEDVFLAAIGLVIVSILRIYYDSYIERKKIKHLCSLINVHNNIDEDKKEGLLVMTSNYSVISANAQVAFMFGVNIENIDTKYLKSLKIKLDSSDEELNFIDAISSMNYIQSANVSKTKSIISISVNKIYPKIAADGYWYVLTMRDLSNVNELYRTVKDLMVDT